MKKRNDVISARELVRGFKGFFPIGGAGLVFSYKGLLYRMVKEVDVPRGVGGFENTSPEKIEEIGEPERVGVCVFGFCQNKGEERDLWYVIFEDSEGSVIHRGDTCRDCIVRAKRKGLLVTYSHNGD